MFNIGDKISYKYAEGTATYPLCVPCSTIVDLNHSFDFINATALFSIVFYYWFTQFNNLFTILHIKHSDMAKLTWYAQLIG